MKLRRLILLTGLTWAGRKLWERRSRGKHGGRGGPDDRPVETGGDGHQTDPPVAGAGGH